MPATPTLARVGARRSPTTAAARNTSKAAANQLRASTAATRNAVSSAARSAPSRSGAAPPGRLPKQRDTVRVHTNRNGRTSATPQDAVVLGRAKVDTRNGKKLGLHVVDREGNHSVVPWDRKHAANERGSPITGRVRDDEKWKSIISEAGRTMRDTRQFIQRNLPESEKPISVAERARNAADRSAKDQIRRGAEKGRRSLEDTAEMI